MTRAKFFRPGKNPACEPYAYKACGLDGIYLLNGYEVEEHDGVKHIFVEHEEELHREIARHVICTRKSLSGKEIRFLRNTLDLTQKQLALKLGNNSQSVARWEKGEIEIPADAEKLLRIFVFATIATPEERDALRELIVQRLAELDDMDEREPQSAAFERGNHWKQTKCVAEPAYAH